jgi:hypothetical protein
LKIHFQLSYYLSLGLPSGPLPRPYPQEVDTMLLKYAQFAFIFSIPLSYALQWPHYGLISRENVLRFPAGIRDFFPFFPKNSDRLWAHSDPHSINAGCTFPLDKTVGAWRWLLTHLLPRFSVSGATHPLPQSLHGSKRDNFTLWSSRQGLHARAAVKQMAK